jgi:hypothetical protein
LELVASVERGGANRLPQMLLAQYRESSLEVTRGGLCVRKDMKKAATYKIKVAFGGIRLGKPL